jgi:hypothetical protein
MFAISALVLALLLALLIRFWPAARLDMRRLVEDASMIWRR